MTIPKEIRDQFGLGPETEVEFRVVGSNNIVLSSRRAVPVRICNICSRIPWRRTIEPL